jgi:hypothetical protein
MHKSLLSILALLLFTACSSKEDKALLKTYQDNKIYHKYLQDTEKVQLKINGVTKVLLTATHLSNRKKKKTSEVFIIGFYAEESQLQHISKEGFSLTLDGKASISVEKLDEKSPYLKDISFLSEWSTFYMVRFPHIDKKSFHLILTSDIYGKGSLYFAKVAKYVLNKKNF